MFTSEILDLAADAIQREGWARAEDPTGLCIVQSVYRAGADSRAREVLLAVEEYLDWNFLRDGYIWQWNDTVARDEQHVVEVLRAAAAVERAKESLYETEDQPLPEFEEAA